MYNLITKFYYESCYVLTYFIIIRYIELYLLLNRTVRLIIKLVIWFNLVYLKNNLPLSKLLSKEKRALNNI